MDRFEGVGAEITLDGEVLVLTRTGLLAGVRRIPLAAVSEVRFKAARRVLPGWLQLGLGGREPGKAGLNEPDTVTFGHKAAESFEALRTLLEDVVARNVAAGIDPASIAFDEGRTAGELRRQRQDERVAGIRARTEERVAGISSHAAEWEEKGARWANSIQADGDRRQAAIEAKGAQWADSVQATVERARAAMAAKGEEWAESVRAAEAAAEAKAAEPEPEPVPEPEPARLRQDVAEAAVGLEGLPEIAVLAELLDGSETVRKIASGTRDGSAGIAVVTDRRFLFLDTKLLWGDSREELPLTSVASVSTETSIWFGTLTVHSTAGQTLVVDSVNDDVLGEFAAVLRSEAAAARTPPPAPVAAPDVLDQLRKLGELRDAGVLTEEEFAAKKATLLDRL